IVAGQLPHAGLQRIDFRKYRKQVEGAQQFGKVAGNEGINDLAALLRSARESAVMAGYHLLLQEHAAFLVGFTGDARAGGCGSHAWLHRRMESENVPACSRMTANWPVSSEYLNCVRGMPSRS